MNKRSLILEGAQAATDARDRVGADEIKPIDVYDAAEKLGIRVRFVDISMEGFYKKGPPAMMLLSSLRPLPRRAFTCGHEAGHHVFGHGSTVDELKEDERKSSEKPEEILADAFSAFLLMPTLGIRHAFAVRKWKIETASPFQLATVASEFGVGYTTLLTHLTYIMTALSKQRLAELSRWTPQRIREDIVPNSGLSALSIVDRHSEASVVDLEIGNGILLPRLTDVGTDKLRHVQDVNDFSLFKAISRGSGRLRVGLRDLTVRIGPEKYVGLAKYRYLEEADD
ncbi:ImmA/IrrE family metallo-endopeptidase [Aminobacter anthyllidis]|uniref:ImmA/IrrE family metallo-endopeptidase n=1 Tax=Aminobacter anthyllidis TaxID=1035067 RepID=A0A9X1D639_9HYPH|nr:ImmA/IrrE family metallo-endopeptidase [Aminobacter anthyllidis]MBT1158475.1 ImmA/IrrE family metallo-endopeptidase [Aminobacter anthyllidis]